MGARWLRSHDQRNQEFNHGAPLHYILLHSPTPIEQKVAFVNHRKFDRRHSTVQPYFIVLYPRRPA